MSSDEYWIDTHSMVGLNYLFVILANFSRMFLLHQGQFTNIIIVNVYLTDTLYQLYQLQIRHRCC